MFNAQDLHISNSQINNVGGDQHNIITNIFTTVEEKAFTLLKPAVRNDYHVPRCMDGTRESVFKEIDDWLNGPDDGTAPNILWINGSPGAGKSAIASSLVSILTEKRRLGSYFFFKRGDANLSDPSALWRTVAYDLSQFHSSVKACMAEFLNRPGCRDTDIHLHFKCLIEDVLTRCSGELCSFAPVIVIDALDECGSDDSHYSQRQILLDTLTRWTRLPRSFKLLITSRDERVPNSFQDALLCHKITLETGDSVSEETRSDIRVFFERSFEEIRPMLGLPRAWPGELTIEQLTKRAAGLFIWAKTAMAFIGEKRGKPRPKLRLVLAGNLGTKSENIDTLYRNILHFSFEDSDDDTLRLFRMVLGTIIVAKVPLHRDDLKHFIRVLGLEVDDEDEGDNDWEIDAILNNLSSVIDLDTSLRFKHLSFIEFLSDPNRCRERHFVIDPGEHHHHMTLSCLRVLNAELRFNISGMTSSYERNEDVVDLPKRIPSRIGYASEFWADHFTVSPSPKDLLAGIEDFLYDKLLFWLEVLSILGKYSSASTLLMKVATSSNGISHLPPSVAQYMMEANEFVIAFREPISCSAPHIYLTALPFSRQGGMVREAFQNRFPSVLSVETSTVGKQYPILVLEGHSDYVNCVAFSPDGKRIVSCSDDCTIRVWDPDTGEAVMKPLEGHTGSITSITISPDSKHIVSASHDGSIRMWDAVTGDFVLKPFEGHIDAVTSISFSPDGRRIVSGSYDCMICIWDAENGGAVMDPLEGHTSCVRSVAFSPNGKRIVSGSDDHMICVWDAVTGDSVLESFEGDLVDVTSVAFSPDGEWIISSSYGYMIRVWDAGTGEIVMNPLVGHTALVTSVAFSPNGKRIASGSDDRMIRIWDAETGGAMLNSLDGHTSRVTSVAFSPDGKRIVSGSRDCTICVWDMETREPVLEPLERGTSIITSVVFSPDGKRLVSGSHDHTIHVWDAETGDEISKPLEGHTDSVSSVAFSFDGKYIVSGSYDYTVRVWDAEIGGEVLGPLKGHTNVVTSVVFSPNKKRIVSGSSDNTIRIWDAKTGEAMFTPLEGHTDYITSVAFSPNDKHILSSSFDRTIRVWDAETGEAVLTPLKGHNYPVTSVAFSPDGKRFVSGSFDLRILVWDAETCEPVLKPRKGHTEAVTSISFSPDGRRIVSGAYDHTICVWDAETGETVLKPHKGHTDSVTSVAFSPNDRCIASASLDGTIRLWDVEPSHSIPLDSQPHVDPSSSMTIDNQILPVKLSSNPHHALLDVEDLLRGIDPAKAFSIRDGWILGPRDELLFWVPRELQRGLWWPRTKAIIGAPIANIDLSRMVHGPSWSKCFSE